MLGSLLALEKGLGDKLARALNAEGMAGESIALAESSFSSSGTRGNGAALAVLTSRKA